MNTDDLRARMRAVFKPKPQDSSATTSKSEKPVLGCYDIDSVSKNGVRLCHRPNTVFTSETNDLTRLHQFSANRDSQREKLYEATSFEAGGGRGCHVQIFELPPPGAYRKVFAHLLLKPPDLIPVDRWRQCVEDGKRFLTKWGDQAEALGWSSGDLFGLAPAPSKPHPSYQRLSRYHCTGLCWLLEGRDVVALTESTATIKSAAGNITTYRRFNKPALGPLGDSLEEFV
jgi:hypothetical protein